jgi:hypothetical protein
MNNTTDTNEQLASSALFGDWLPIETAPANQDVLLFCPNRHFTNPARIELGKASHGCHDKHGNEVRGTWSLHAWATHWMPLPDLPPNAEVCHGANNQES